MSDPAKPVPYIGYTAIGMTREYMVDDQRFAATRPDVLVYQTDVLEEDVTFAGPITAMLHVSTTGTDSDFVVKLIDVYSGDFPNPSPNPANVQMGGYQQLVRGEPMRGKFRNSYEKPEPFVPGEATHCQLDDARYLPHVPPRPPHHDPGSKFVVSARGSQSAEILRYLPRGTGGFSEGHAARVSLSGGGVAGSRSSIAGALADARSAARRRC